MRSHVRRHHEMVATSATSIHVYVQGFDIQFSPRLDRLSNFVKRHRSFSTCILNGTEVTPIAPSPYALTLTHRTPGLFDSMRNRIIGPQSFSTARRSIAMRWSARHPETSMLTVSQRDLSASSRSRLMWSCSHRSHLSHLVSGILLWLTYAKRSLSASTARSRHHPTT